MATFQVPQFIEQEAKIIGPLTIVQFGYAAASGVLLFFTFYIFNFFLWVMIAVVIGMFTIALIFVKVHGQSLPHILFSAFAYLWEPHTYTWQRVLPQSVLEIPDFERIAALRRTMGIQERIQDFALKVTTGTLFQKQERTKEQYQTVTFATGEKRRVKKVDY